MKEFNNFKEFGDFLNKIITDSKLHQTAFLEISAQWIEDEAKRKFGIYQDPVGPYPGWRELSEYTKEDRLRKNFSENDPLYRTGDLMHSIYHKVQGNEAAIGSDDDIMVYQELGTPAAKHPIPARPVLGPAAFESKRKIEKIADEVFSAWLNGKKPVKKFTV